MDRADRNGIGIAVAGHALLFAALSLGLIAAPNRPLATTVPVDIQIVDDVAERDQAPRVSRDDPAPSIAPAIGEPVDSVSPLPPPPPTVAQSAPSKAPARPDHAAKLVSAAPAPPAPAAKPAPVKTVAPRGSRLGSDFLKGIADQPTASTSDVPRAAVGTLAANSIGRLVREQLKPYWKSPTGADAELLRTELSISLSRDGQVTEVHVLRTTGQTDSNRRQVKLHQEAAIKAVRLAAPFSLPPALYDDWRLLEPVGFDRRLAQ